MSIQSILEKLDSAFKTLNDSLKVLTNGIEHVSIISTIILSFNCMSIYNTTNVDDWFDYYLIT